MEDRYSLNSYMFSSLLLRFYYFSPVTDDNIFVLNMLLKVPDILSSLISFFIPFCLPLSNSYNISFWFIIVIISIPLYH